MPSPGSTSGGRLSLACQRCRTRKTKCDLQIPRCSSCTRAGVECVSSQRAHFSHQNPISRDFVENLEAKLVFLEEQVQVRQLDQSCVVHPGQSSPDEGSQENPTSTIESIIDVNDLVVPSTLMSKESRALNLTRMTEAAITHTEPSTRAYHSYVSDLQISQVYLALSQSGQVQTFVEAYMNYIQRDLPFLDATLIRDHLNVHSVDDAHTRALPPILLMVLSIGALMPGVRDVACGHYAFLFATSARRALSTTLQTDSIEALQLILLLQIFSMLDPHGGNTWHLCGLSFRTAIVLGLHKEQYYVKNPSQSATARKSFWTAYVLDRCVSLALDRPFGIDDDDISTKVPNIEDEGGRLRNLADSALAASKSRSNSSTSTSALKKITDGQHSNLLTGTDQHSADYDLGRLLVYHLSVWSLGPPFASSITTNISNTRNYVNRYVNLIGIYAQRGYVLPEIIAWSLLHSSLLEEFLGTLLSKEIEDTADSSFFSSRSTTRAVLRNLGRTHKSVAQLHYLLECLSRPSDFLLLPVPKPDAEKLENASTRKLLKSLSAMLDLT